MRLPRFSIAANGIRGSLSAKCEAVGVGQKKSMDDHPLEKSATNSTNTDIHQLLPLKICDVSCSRSQETDNCTIRADALM
jgi:hypothetical protein